MFKRIHPFFVFMVVVLLGLLAITTVADIIHSVRSGQPISYSIMNLQKIAIAGVLGAIAGYYAKSTDDDKDK